MARNGRGLRSMTGYGAGAAALGIGRVTVEVRTVNQRFLDVRITAPREYAPWEATVRDLVRKHVVRGRVEVYVGRNAPPSVRTRVVANVEAARAHAAAWRTVQRALGLRGEIDLGLLRAADVLQTVEIPTDIRDELPAVRRALATALGRLDRARRREGAHLARDMGGRVARLRVITRGIRTHAARAAVETRARATERMQQLLKGSNVDAGRVAQEAAYLAERGDVTEEVVRLGSHLVALRRALRGGDEGVGKQIEFLLQETHREINTIGSKVNNLAITALVVEAKGEVERLREQVQNVE